jgi:cell wall-associated NlpC family hydrolase
MSMAATGPNRFDCSGFVFYILKNYYGDLLKQNNISLPRSSRAMAGVGTPVSRDSLEIGDLVFFNNTSGNINHVGLYIGNQQFIHASSGSSMSVIISPLNTGNYLRRYATARRLFTQ